MIMTIKVPQAILGSLAGSAKLVSLPKRSDELHVVISSLINALQAKSLPQVWAGHLVFPNPQTQIVQIFSLVDLVYVGLVSLVHNYTVAYL